MKLAILSLALAAVFLVACGSGATPTGESPTKAPEPTAGERILHLASGDYTESEYRARMRANLTMDGAGELCQSLTGLSDLEIYDVIAELGRGGRENVQDPEPESQEFAGAILKEECDRIF